MVLFAALVIRQKRQQNNLSSGYRINDILYNNKDVKIMIYKLGNVLNRNLLTILSSYSQIGELKPKIDDRALPTTAN